MGYIQSHLTDDEKVMFKTKRHWFTTIPIPSIWLILAALCFWGVFGWENGGWLKWPGYVLLAIGIIHMSKNVIQAACAEFGVTNKRVIIKTGVIWRKTLEVILQKVESISVDQSIPGRVLGYGTITITGSGGSSEPHANIAKPLEFRMKVQEQIQKLEMDGD